MTTRLRKPLILFGTTILAIQALFMPIGMVYGETTINTEEQEQVELPPMKNYLEEQASDPRFFFTRSRMQGTVEESVQVNFFSDQEVSEARVFLPEEATLLKDQLSTGISVEEGEQPNEWIVQSKRAQNTFVLPLVFDKAGNYEMSVEETTVHLEISEQEETSEEVPVEETESSDEDQAGQEELKEENGIEEEQENEAPTAEGRETVSEAPQERHTDGEETDEVSQVVEPTVFDGETAEVTTMAEFREAVGNPAIGIISVQANLTQATANVLTVDRPLLIQGNGYTLTFGINGFYFQLEEVTQASTIRLENATLAKVGVTPLINATVESSKNWTVELEDITEVNANTMRLASLPEGRIHFTGGVSTFTRTTSAQTFIEAKEVLATNQAEVTISRGNAVIFSSSETIVEPTLAITEGASITITTTSGVTNPIDFRGNNPQVVIADYAKLSLTSAGPTTAATDTTNNAILLTGNEPQVIVSNHSELTIATTNAKRGILLIGSNPKITMNESTLTISGATGQGIRMIGNQGKVDLQDSSIVISGQTVTRMYVEGEESVVSSVNTSGNLTSTSGFGVYLTGGANSFLLDGGSVWSITGSGNSQNIGIISNDSKLSVLNNSSLSVSSAAGTAVNLLLEGDNSEFRVDNNSSFSSTSGGTTATASDTSNIALSMIGSTPSFIISQESTVTINTTNAKRAIVLNGSNPTFSAENSSVSISTSAAQGIRLFGESGTLDFTNSEVVIDGLSTTRVYIEGAGGKILSSGTKATLTTSIGFGIALRSGADTIVIDESSKWIVSSTGTSQNISIESDNPKLHVLNGSTLTASSEQGTTINVLLQGVNPEIRVENQAVVKMNLAGANSSPTDTSNLGISLVGNAPSIFVLNGSEMNLTTTESKRGMNLNGTTPQVSIENSSVNIETVRGDGMRLSGDAAAFQMTNDAQVVLSSTTGGGLVMLGNDQTISLENTSTMTLNSITGNSISMTGDNGTLEVLSGSSLESVVGDTNAISIIGDAPTVRVLGENSLLHAVSNQTSIVDGNATMFLGSGSYETIINNYLVEVGNKANLILEANLSSALTMQGNNGTFKVYDQANLSLSGGNTDNIGTARNVNAPLRFMRSGPAASAGGHLFDIDNSKIHVSKTGGNGSAVRMYGSDNAINVRNSGEFTVLSPGNGTALDGGVGGRNQGIHYVEGSNNSFSITDPGSAVVIRANFGAAIDMENAVANVSTTNGGYFEASGRTATTAAGIFNAGDLKVNFDNPLFMDFRNNRVGGGNIFNNTANSVLDASNSDLSVWRDGSDLDGDPDLNFPSLDFSFSGVNFNTLTDTSHPEVLNTTTFGTTGLTAYSRLSSNNGRWAIADELRVPTNADKKIHGRVSLPVGLDDSRPAWDGEAIVTVEVESTSGETTQEYTAKTVGNSNESSGISIYGEEPRGGLFEIDLEKPLEAGSKVRISKVELTSGEITNGFEHQILTETVEVFPIIPPTPAQFSSSIIAQNSTTIQGRTDNLEAEVTAIHNGKPLNIEAVTIEPDGRFQLDLSEVSLEMDDEIQVFLRDTEGSAIAAGVINPPETNNARGNINPAKELAFHDITFEAATTLIVGDTGPISPVDPLDPEKEVDPENPPTLPEDQGVFSIDFVSQFDFGVQAISAQDQTYYAKPQRLLAEDGTVLEGEERPNYVQISDRRSTQERDGWELSVRQNDQFTNRETGEELTGARLILQNQQIATAQGGTAPGLAHTNPMTLNPGGAKRTLLKAQGPEGEGTWIYRFGDADSADKSVALEVPGGATPSATSYKTTLTWELSSVPNN